MTEIAVCLGSLVVERNCQQGELEASDHMLVTRDLVDHSRPLFSSTSTATTPTSSIAKEPNFWSCAQQVFQSSSLLVQHQVQVTSFAHTPCPSSKPLSPRCLTG